jgi:predicted Zn-dependent protease
MVAIGAMVRSIVARVPADVERQHGELAIKELGLDLAAFTNEAAQLGAIAQPLLQAVPGSQKWEFHVADIDMPNAFALPGGHIVVTTGMLALVERPEELLGVVAHEMAHVVRKHNLRMQIAAAGPMLVLEVFLRGRSGAMGAMAGGSALLVAQSFSQEYEKEADEVGWDYLVAANIDPRGMIESFRKLKEWEAKSNERDVLPKAFRSHPDLDKRIARLEAKWRRQPKKSGFVELEPLP